MGRKLGKRTKAQMDTMPETWHEQIRAGDHHNRVWHALLDLGWFQLLRPQLRFSELVDQWKVASCLLLQLDWEAELTGNYVSLELSWSGHDEGRHQSSDRQEYADLALFPGKWQQHGDRPTPMWNLLLRLFAFVDRLEVVRARMLCHLGPRMAIVAIDFRLAGGGTTTTVSRAAKVRAPGSMFCLVVILPDATNCECDADLRPHTMEFWDRSHRHTPDYGAAAVGEMRGRPFLVKEDIHRDENSDGYRRVEGGWFFWVDAATQWRWTPPAGAGEHAMVIYYITSTVGLLPVHLALLGIGHLARYWLECHDWPRWGVIDREEDKGTGKK